jgi:hypothetical protein
VAVVVIVSPYQHGLDGLLRLAGAFGVKAGFYGFGGGHIAAKAGKDAVKGNGCGGVIVAKHVVKAKANAF